MSELECNKNENEDDITEEPAIPNFKKPSMIKSDKISKLDNDWERFECDQCDKQYNQRNNLYMHKQVFHLGKRKHCPHFDYSTTSTGHLKKHIERIHDKIH